ncbi:MAG: hypothetical protein R6V12_06300, partial [Candidatus Hydrogenedentota bacterium]
MNQYRWPIIGGYGMWRQNTVFALLIIVCFPAFAFDDGSLPTVSDTTAVALKNLTSSETTPIVPNATRTIYDTASPTVGTAQSPDYAPATSVSIDYSGMSDTVSGLKTVSLWVRA